MLNFEPRRGLPNDLSSTVTSPSFALDTSPLVVPRRGRDHLVDIKDREAFVAALRRGDEHATAAFFREFSPLVEHTIGRILGFDDELADATQEAFLRAMRSLEKLRDPQALVDWLLHIAVNTGADCARRRRRRRWLILFDPEKHEEPIAPDADDAGREALRATYRVLDRMSADQRTVFALRFIDGMELTTLASACNCSLATLKRRLERAVTRFRILARNEKALTTWLAREAETATREEGR